MCYGIFAPHDLSILSTAAAFEFASDKIYTHDLGYV